MRKFFIVLSLFLWAYTGSAQNDSVIFKNENKLNVKYFTSYFTDSWKVLKSPTKWQGRDWLKSGLLLGGVAVIYTQDQNINDFIQRNRSNSSDKLSSHFFDPSGYGLFTLPIFGGLYIYGAVWDHPEAENFALMGLKIFIISGVFNQVLKFTFHRHRPFQDAPANPNNWGGPFANTEYTSFPSGHSTAAFATATYVSMYFKNKRWVPWVSYTLASGVALSRLNDNKHWASDVVAGAILGHFIAKSVFNNNANHPSAITIAPYPGGFSMCYRF